MLRSLVKAAPSLRFMATTRCMSVDSRVANDSDNIDKMRSRLLYQSKKRGILENDIILGDFADEKLATMDKATLQDYDKLINGSHMEWDLFYYVSGRKAAPADLENSIAFKLVKQFVDDRKKQ